MLLTSLVGATRVAQQEENLKAVDVELSAEVMTRITEMSGAFVAF